MVAPRPESGDVEGLAGFTRARLPPHTDRSLQPDPPSLLAAVMISPAVSGGQASLVDGAQVLAELRRTFAPATISSLRLRGADGLTVPVMWISDGLAKIRFRDDRVAAPYCTTGDRAALDGLRDLISASATSVPLGPGDGYVLHNHRYLHGRLSFTGDRLLARMLAKVSGCHRLAWLNKGFPVANP
jgi:hypothetical protein